MHKIIKDAHGRTIGVAWSDNKIMVDKPLSDIANGFSFECAPANSSPLAHDNQSQQLAMPANPARWLDPV